MSGKADDSTFEDLLSTGLDTGVLPKQLCQKGSVSNAAQCKAVGVYQCNLSKGSLVIWSLASPEDLGGEDQIRPLGAQLLESLAHHLFCLAPSVHLSIIWKKGLRKDFEYGLIPLPSVHCTETSLLASMVSENLIHWKDTICWPMPVKV
jgi:hypothetical protein